MRTFQLGSILALGLVALPKIAGATTWELDPSHTHVGFNIKHLMISDVHGDFKKFSGTIEMDDKDPSKSVVDVSIDIDSVSTGDEKRDAHLKSPDFFDSAKFPKMTFKSTKVTKAGKDKYKVIGDLTIRDVTKPCELTVTGPAKPVKDPWGGTRTAANAVGKIKRKDFGITWNKSLDGGGVVVGEEVNLEIAAELMQKAAAAPAEAKK
jgi:polyisoprenoid-binding protein YceI